MAYGTYGGLFLISLATLALEIAFTRLLSALIWYHLGFVAVSVALLGLTAGGITVYVRPRWFQGERLVRSLTTACLLFASVVPLSLVVLCNVHIDFRVAPGIFAAITVAITLPFYFSGIAITAVLTKCSLPVGRMYAANLAGSALGSLLVLGGLEVMGALNVILACSLLAVAAAAAFACSAPVLRVRAADAFLLAFLAVFGAVNYGTSHTLRLHYVKGHVESKDEVLLHKWNSFSLITVLRQFEDQRFYWGKSRFAPATGDIPQYFIAFDGGDAMTILSRYETAADIDHLRYDLTNMAYYLRPEGGACIIGVGGGRDVQGALAFGHERVVGIEVNPIITRLYRTIFSDFSGIVNNDKVTLVTDEARSYVSRTKERFAVIQMSLIDTWAATGSGAYTLSENALYTREAWKIFLEHLAGDGIFTVSRWYDPGNLGETGRALSLAVASLFDAGSTDPSRHIIMITTKNLATMLICKRPFSEQETGKIKAVADKLGFDAAIVPGETPGNRDLARILGVKSAGEMRRAFSDTLLNYDPPTDESPYFFNMLKLRHLNMFNDIRMGLGVTRGNIAASVALLWLTAALAGMAAVTVILPLVLSVRGRPDVALVRRGAAYFSLIGAGFMFAEIALAQKLSVFLGHPVYALGVVLFAIIASAGVGSYLSDRIDLSGRYRVYLLPVFAAASLVTLRFIMPPVFHWSIASAGIVKVLVAVILIFPAGVILGCCLPVGMRLLGRREEREKSWYFALSGVFGVLGSALALFVSIYFTISLNLYIAGLCYIALLFCLPRLFDVHAQDAERPASPAGASHAF